MVFRKILLGAISAWGLLACAPLVAAAPVGDADPVVFSFAFVGCNRLNWGDPTVVDSPSTANTAQLLQTFSDIGALTTVPRYLFLAGDIVLGEKTGAGTLAAEISAWKNLVRKNKINLQTKLVVFTGNHELLQSIESPPGSKNYVETPNQPAYPFWQTSMKRFIYGNDGPAMGGPDQLVNDEKGLSYTFKAGGNLFMVINTDTEIDPQIAGNIPFNWIKTRLAAAQQDTNVKNIFVLGHKPIYPNGGDSGIASDQAGPLYAALNAPAKDGKASKVRAYLTAHLHKWSYQQDLSASGMPGTVPQIIAGNAGSSPDHDWKTSGYFGFTVISVKRSGAVIAESYGRPIPTPYDLQSPIAQATLRETKSLFVPQP